MQGLRLKTALAAERRAYAEKIALRLAGQSDFWLPTMRKNSA